MGRIGSTPTGRSFLAGVSIKKLERAYGEEKDGRAKLRLLGAMFRKKRKTMREISEELHTPLGTVHAWLQRFLRGWMKNMHDKQRSGGPSRLGVEEFKRLRHDLIRGPKASGFDAPFWTTKMVLEHVRRRYGREYRARGMRNVLHRAGFSSKKPRPTNAKRASKEEVESFKKRQSDSSGSTQGRDSRSSFWTRQHSP